MPSNVFVLFEERMDSFAMSLDVAMRGAQSQYEQLRQTGEKGELTQIYVSFLQSSVLCKLPWLRIDLYDERGRNNSSECSSEWDVPAVSDMLYRDTDGLAKNRDRIKDYELEQLWLDLADPYMIAFEQKLPQIISHCPISHELNCQWHFGQYLGETVIVRERLKDAIF